MHVGIEMGGTSCKIGIFTADFQLKAKTVIQTSSTDAQFTLNEISTWIAEQCGQRHPESIGIACFGPICLDKTSQNYGTITTTPKLAWQGVAVLKHFTLQHSFTDRQEKIYIDTDCNVCALYEF